jgi:RNA-binding protein NOB1
MVLEQGASSRKVVIDAGAAIKLQRLDRFGGELFTTGGVIREIRDENARAMLKTLPTELRVREPLAEDIAFTKQFAKATGDLGFLSQNDMELIALTVGLHREEGGTVKQRPAMIQTIEGGCAFDWAPANVSKPQSAAADGVEEAGKGEVMEASAEADDEEGWTEIPVKAGRPASSATAVDEFAGVAHFAEASSKTSVAEVLAAVAAAEAASEEAAAEGGTDQPAAALDPATEAADKASTQADAEPAAEASPAAAEAEEEDEEEESDADDDEDGSSAGEWVTQDNMHRFGLGV